MQCINKGFMDLKNKNITFNGRQAYSVAKQ